MTHTRMASGVFISLWIAGYAAYPVGVAQSGGRFEEAKRQAVAYLDSSQFDRAGGKLEEIWEQDQSDPLVAENLIVAYMNGEDRASRSEYDKKIESLLKRVIQMGGKASFLVQHSHEKVPFLQGKTISDYCSGRLSVSDGRLVFVAQARRGVEPHSFELTAGDLRIIPPSRGDKQGGFHIKTKARTYSMVPRTRSRADGDIIVSVLSQHLESR